MKRERHHLRFDDGADVGAVAIFRMESCRRTPGLEDEQHNIRIEPGQHDPTTVTRRGSGEGRGKRQASPYRNLSLTRSRASEPFLKTVMPM